MDDLDHIGQWMGRYREGADFDAEDPKGKFHHVETRIADRFSTHCGRQMGQIEGTELGFHDFVDIEARCLRC